MVVDFERGTSERRGVGIVDCLLLKYDGFGVSLVPERYRRADDQRGERALRSPSLLKSIISLRPTQLHANVCHQMQIHAIRCNFMPLKLHAIKTGMKTLNSANSCH